MELIRLMLCDSQPMFRSALIHVLEASGRFSVFAQAGSEKELIAALRKSAPDIHVLITTLSVDNSDIAVGKVLLGRLRHLYPELRILVLTGQDQARTVQAVMRAGARGFVSTRSTTDVLEQAIRCIHLGDNFLDPRLVHAVMNFDEASDTKSWSDGLTRRESEVFVELCRGLSVSAIATHLHLSIKTVSTHKSNMMKKLTISNTADLIKLGLHYKVC
jgi:DNA-binding NarL/FixJ family response regulator